MGESPVQPDIVVSGFQMVALVVPKKYDYRQSEVVTDTSISRTRRGVLGTENPIVNQTRNLHHKQRSISEPLNVNISREVYSEIFFFRLRISSIGTTFRTNTVIQYFHEFRYFTGVTSLNSNQGSATNAAFANCSNLKEITLPPQLRTLQAWVFSSCSSIFLVNLNEGLQSIRGSVFYYASNFKKVAIPSTVTSISSDTFRYVNTYVVESTLPPQAEGLSERATVSAIYVPDMSVELYKASPVWSNKASVIYSMTRFPKDHPNDPWIEDLREKGLLPDYIDFEDTEAKRICCINWGDYTEIAKTETVTEDSTTVSISTSYTYVHKVNTAATRTFLRTLTSSRAKTEDDIVGETTTTTNYIVGITKEQAAAVTSIGRSVFRGNTVIQYLNELVYFTNASLECYGQQATFAQCSNLKEITLPIGAKPSNTTYGFCYMFSNCTNLSHIGNIEYLNTTGAKNLSTMFNATSKLTGTLDLHNWNVSSVTNCSQMFSGTSVSIINISGWTLGNNCNCDYMFQRCPNLTTINFGTFNFGKITHVYYMFVISPKVANITGAISGINISLDMLNCPLTLESVVVLFNGLADLTGGTSKSITFRKTVYDAIDETTMAIATGKNWNVVRSNSY